MNIHCESLMISDIWFKWVRFHFVMIHDSRWSCAFCNTDSSFLEKYMQNSWQDSFIISIKVTSNLNLLIKLINLVQFIYSNLLFSFWFCNTFCFYNLSRCNSYKISLLPNITLIKYHSYKKLFLQNIIFIKYLSYKI